MITNQTISSDTEAMNVIFGMLLFTLLLFLAYAIFGLIANFLFFRRIGENKWLGLVPIANYYVLFKRFWTVNMFYCYIACEAAFILVPRLEANSFTRILYLAASICVFVIEVLLLDKIRKAYGKGAGYLLGLALLYPVFILMLAYKGTLKDEYEKIPKFERT